MFEALFHYISEAGQLACMPTPKRALSVAKRNDFVRLEDIGLFEKISINASDYWDCSPSLWKIISMGTRFLWIDDYPGCSLLKVCLVEPCFDGQRPCVRQGKKGSGKPVEVCIAYPRRGGIVEVKLVR